MSLTPVNNKLGGIDHRSRIRAFAAAALALALSAPTPVPAADVIKGAQLYAIHCAVCHGRNGAPVMPNAPNFTRGERLMQPDMVLLGTIRTGRGPMPGYLGMLADREILDVIAYLRTLR